MTLIHFANCVALAYVPYLLTYRLSGLSEYNTFWKCLNAAVVYAVTQLLKMLFLATFVVDTVGHYGDYLKHSLDIVDLIALHFIINKIGVSGDLKFLVAGFGWAFSELVCTRLVPFWVGARGTEFSWKYIQLGFESNINLIFHLSTAMLLYQWRTNKNKAIILLLVILTYRNIIFDCLGLEDWTLLGTKAAVAVTTGVVSLKYTLANSHGYSNVW